MRISDLQGDPPRAEKGDDAISLEKIVKGLGHEIRNNLQVISLGLDLIRLMQARPLDDRTIIRGTERIYNLLEEVKEYLSPPEFCVSTDNLTVVLEEIVRRTAEKWQREGCLRIINGKPLPLLRLDWRQFHLTLERVLDFAHALLPPEGQVEVEARVQGSTEQRTIELKVISTGSIPLEVQEQDIFHPFLHVNGHRVGLSLVLAKRTLNSHHGQISFHKETPQQCVLSILLKTY